eukprot:9001803-Pyramimonas_sp.AAC.1
MRMTTAWVQSPGAWDPYVPGLSNKFWEFIDALGQKMVGHAKTASDGAITAALAAIKALGAAFHKAPYSCRKHGG